MDTNGNTKELIKDLCSRLPYEVKVSVNDKVEIVDGISVLDNVIDYGSWLSSEVEEVKPYLFPLESMTEEQKEDLLLTVVGEEGLKLFSVTKDGIISNDKEEQSIENFCFNNINFSNETTEAYIDWLNKNHFDYRGLIPMGLDIDATGLNIY